jgi:hypothetical protein
MAFKKWCNRKHAEKEKKTYDNANKEEHASLKRQQKEQEKLERKEQC